MEDWERRQKLEAALLDAVKRRDPSPAELRTARRAGRKPRTGLMVLLTVLGWGFIAWVWVARPAFVFGPGDPPEPAPAVREARLRFAMYLERRRVEAYVARWGRVPAALSQAGPVEDGVTLERITTGYVIVGVRDDLSLRLTNRMSADSFLGPSLQVLRQ